MAAKTGCERPCMQLLVCRSSETFCNECSSCETTILERSPWQPPSWAPSDTTMLVRQTGCTVQPQLQMTIGQLTSDWSHMSIWELLNQALPTLKSWEHKIVLLSCEFMGACSQTVVIDETCRFSNAAMVRPFTHAGRAFIDTPSCSLHPEMLA